MADPALRFQRRETWRAWLKANHETAKEAVVLLSKKAVPGGLHYEEALEEALCFGWIDGKLRAHGASTFLLRFTPRRADSIWSESNRDRAERLIREGRMTRAGLARVDDAKRSGAWQSAVRPAQVPRLPRDLQAALRADPEAWAHFRAWGDTYRSACIRWALDAKREATRTKRIQRVVQRAREDRRPGIEGF